MIKPQRVITHPQTSHDISTIITPTNTKYHIQLQPQPLQLLLLLFRAMEMAIHPQQHGKENKRNAQHLGEHRPAPLLDEKIDWNAREDTSERRNESVHRDDETGVLRFHALDGDQLTE